MPFCQHILQLISQARAAKLFLHPVDTAKYPTYYNTISQPMDLSTMAHKLENGQYKTAEEFKADFDLMIRNCLKFNPSGEVARDFGIVSTFSLDARVRTTLALRVCFNDVEG